MRRVFCLAILLAGAFLAARSTHAASPLQLDGPEAQWPRFHVKGGQEVALYQPQVDEWVDYRSIRFRLATRVTTAKDAEPVFGVLTVDASTKVDHGLRTVFIADPSISYRFPNVSKEKAAALEKVVRDVLPERRSFTVSLDRLLAYVDRDAGVQPAAEVNLSPPPIFHSDTQAVLVVFIGAPEFRPIAGTKLQAAVNTNWDLLLDANTSKYFLLVNGESWLSTDDPVKGPWLAATAPPAEIKKLPNDENWASIRGAFPGKPMAAPPKVVVTTQPAELILTEGAPQYRPVPGTKLMAVSNTESPIFFLPDEGNHYFLVAGRWFRAADLAGPWSAATMDLPGEFAKIPADSEYAFARASVPGTMEAEDAVLLASVPQTATVKKAGTTIEVTYEGAPKFEPIPQTTVTYAVNSPNQVFCVDSRYYCCHQGVWFHASASQGPWTVCASVPSAIYTIPASHPAHNVTYVYVYEDAPDTVEVGYTSGYTGEYIAHGLLLFGAGILLGAALDDDDDWWYCVHFHYSTHWYSYGCGAIYNPYYGGFYRRAYWYGPYGGAGRIGYYNPVTGGWARGGYRYGPAGSAWAYAGYNPYTDVFKARAGGSSIYGSWSRGYVQVGDEWVRGGTRSGWRGDAAWVQGSNGGAAAAWDTRRGDGVVVKGPNDNVFVGHDGNIYRRDSDGDWEKRDGNGWEKSGNDRSASQPTRREQPQTLPAKPAATRTPAPSSRNVAAPRGNDIQGGLDRDAEARDWGNRATSRPRVQDSPAAGARSVPGVEREAESRRGVAKLGGGKGAGAGPGKGGRDRSGGLGAGAGRRR